MNSGLPPGGSWGLTAVMVVIVSWILNRYLAPKSWKEWTRAGLVQAFIVALYAEMYGFPLTICLLTGWLGIPIPWLHQSGHLWAAIFGWGDLGAMIEMLVGYTVVFSGISLLIEGWREVYRATQKKELATDGLYAVVRHPQYTGIFLAIFGQSPVHSLRPHRAGALPHDDVSRGDTPRVPLAHPRRISGRPGRELSGGSLHRPCVHPDL